MPSFTRKAIKESFMKLLKERPLNKISVRDIVEDCGINRNSFYYHFRDVPALIEEIIMEEADSIIHKYPSISSIEECFNVAFQFMLDNKKAILHIYNSVNRDIFERYLMRMCEYVVTTYLDTVFGEDAIGEGDRRIMIRFIKCELFGLSLDWLSMGMKDDVIDDLQRLLMLFRGLPDEMIRRCREN